MNDKLRDTPQFLSILKENKAVAKQMKKLRLVFCTWHDNNTFLEEFDMNWKFLRFLHLRAAPVLSVSDPSERGRRSGVVRGQISDLMKLNLGSVTAKEAKTVLDEISRIILKID